MKPVQDNRNVFDKLNDGIRELESSIVNFLSVFAPWLAPVIPAYMTYQHAFITLGFPWLVAVTAAVVVEILGFSAVSTFLAFWFYNRKDGAKTRRAPIEVIVIAFVFYLTLIISTNVLLDTFPNNRYAEIAVRALFTLQTIPAALIVAVRTQHRDLLSEISKEKARKLSESSQKVSEEDSGTSETPQKVSGKFPKDWRSLRPTLSQQDLANLAALDSEGIKQVAVRYEVDVRTVTNWRAYAKNELGIN